MRADEIMTPAVVTVQSTQTLGEAIEALGDGGFRHLPILGDAGQLIGMLSDRDVRSLGLRATLDGATLQTVQARLRGSVSAAMQGDVATVTPDTELPALIDAMLEAGVGALPVVDEHSDTLLGIVSYVDVLRAVRETATA